MTESYQILLFAVISALTIMLVVIGYQIFQIFSEVKKMLVKFNTMVDGAVSISNTLGKSVQNLNGFTAGVKAVFKLLGIFKKDKPMRRIEDE